MNINDFPFAHHVDNLHRSGNYVESDVEITTARLERLQEEVRKDAEIFKMFIRGKRIFPVSNQQ